MLLLHLLKKVDCIHAANIEIIFSTCSEINDDNLVLGGYVKANCYYKSSFYVIAMVGIALFLFPVLCVFIFSSRAVIQSFAFPQGSSKVHVNVAIREGTQSSRRHSRDPAICCDHNSLIVDLSSDLILCACEHVAYGFQTETADRMLRVKEEGL